LLEFRFLEAMPRGFKDPDEAHCPDQRYDAWWKTRVYPQRHGDSGGEEPCNHNQGKQAVSDAGIELLEGS
jgi:hypothetical protein